MLFRYEENECPSVLCAENLARLLEDLDADQTAFSKYAPYLVVSYVSLVMSHPLSLPTKVALMPGIYSLLDMSTEHEYRLIHRVLDLSGKATFQRLYEEYRANWRFTGQI